MRTIATTSLWRIHGEIGKVILYAENPDKTTETETVKTFAKEPEEQLGDVIDYISRDNATQGGRLVSGLNCSPETARKQMLETKRRFGKLGGVTAYHGYQSFREGEVTPAMAHMIGFELANWLWGKKYEVVIATHVDKESHIHNHFVINTVSFVDGRKYHRTKEDYRKMQEASDLLCEHYGLSVVRHPEGKGKHYCEWAAEKNGKPTYRSMIRKDIDRAIKASMTEREFFQCLKEMGYEVKLRGKTGKPLERPSLKPKGAERFFRFDRLGEDYTLEEIRERILETVRRTVPFPEEEQEKCRRYRKDHPPRTKARGLAALYYHYCYELHILTKYPTSVKQVSFFMREDLRKLDLLDEQARLLGRNQIETLEDLNAFRDAARGQIEILEMSRKVQRNLLKRAVRQLDAEAQTQIKTQIAQISAEIRKQRRYLMLCDRIEERSGKTAEELEWIRNERKEGGENNEQFRGSGRAGRTDVPKRD